MEKFNWKGLQNESDIRGIAIKGVEDEAVNLSPSVVERLGESFIYWLSSRVNKGEHLRISVGMDSRLSGPKLKKTLCDTFINYGIDVYDLGLASTPAMFMTTLMAENPADGAIMLTASHLPYNRNGLKFYTSKGGLEKKDISDILDFAAGDSSLKKAEKKGKVIESNYIDEYASNFVDMIRSSVKDPVNFNEPLKGFKIVVDAGNGAGGFYATKVLSPLGADISDSQFLEPDGNFPNHIPNPEDEVAMASVVRKVQESDAHLGIIFDTDVDRSALVLEGGHPINRNQLIALISAVVLDEHPGTTIVTDSITSNGLAWFINDYLKGKHHRFKRGYKNVINEAIRLNREGSECHLAIETSGHAAFKENYFLDDGAYLVTKLIIKMAQIRRKGKRLISLIESMPLPAQSREIRIGIKARDFKEYGKKVIMDLALFAGNKKGWDLAPDNFEGIRINSEIPNQDGWFLLRLSLHDPVLPLNIESEVNGGVEEMIKELLSFFKSYDKLDLSVFDQ